MFKLFASFLTKMKDGFRRISRATRHDVPVEDLENDAFVLAIDIGERRGRPIDFSNPDDQDLVMAALYVEKVKRGDWKMRKAARIDQEPDGDESATSWADRLAADSSSDPLVSLLLRESAQSVDAMLACSYSQATAYVMVFTRFKNDREEICAYLVVSNGTLYRRVTVAADTVRLQPSLFDRVERIDEAFMPKRGKLYAAKVEDHRQSQQWVWQFE